MCLAPGTRLAAYEITGLIGAGGTGEVYRARDTRLKRDVAIKVLPEAFATDPERLARFQREAELLATLNHPNIAQVYGLEDRALVLELVEGPTLADRIAQGPMPLDEALPIAKQIAEALEAAHERGIIHRDLKPANIKLTPDGTVKVLDFGLAKAVEPVSAVRADPSNSPTITSPAMTMGGLILGTAPYMSPEQAKGKPVDKRTDIWAFGCVLYEMLTRKQAFDGRSVPEVLAHVLEREPDYSALPAEVPPSVRRLLRWTLAKEVSSRLADIRDARLEINDSEEKRFAVIGSTRPHRGKLVATACISAAITAAVIVGTRQPEVLQPPLRPVARFTITLPSGSQLFVNRNRGANFQPALALSPDGSRLVYAATDGSGNQQLFLRTIDRLDPRPIRGTDGASHPFFSPDGKWVGFTANNKIQKISVDGGRPVVLADGFGVDGATWLDDGTIIFNAFSIGSYRGLMKLSAAGGAPQQFLSPDSQHEDSLASPDALPDSQTVLFTVRRRNADYAGAAIAAVRIDTGERKAVLEGASMPRYVRTGHLVFVRSGKVFAVAFDPRTLEVKGDPVPVLDTVMINPTSGDAQWAISASGTMAYVSGGEVERSSTLTWADRQGRTTPIDAPPRRYEWPRLSPDGTRLALTIQSPDIAGNRDVWVYRFDRGTLSRLTFEKEQAESPIWTADGTFIAYVAGRTTPREFRRRSADGSGLEELLGPDNRHSHLGAWAPDGSAMVSVIGSGEGAGTLQLLSLRPTFSARSLMQTSAQISAPALSPDGRWLAYSSNENQRFEIYVQPFPGPGGKYQISSDGGGEPRWSGDGHELFFRDGDSLMAVSINAVADRLNAGRPIHLFDAPWATTGGPNRDAWYDVHRDGTRFVMIRAAEAEVLDEIVVVQNWFEELKLRVPTN